MGDIEKWVKENSDRKPAFRDYWEKYAGLVFSHTDAEHKSKCKGITCSVL